MTFRDDIKKDWYDPYLAACNERRFDDLRHLVHSDIDGAADGSVFGIEQYIGTVRRIVEAFPDYHWELEHMLIDGDWLAVIVHGAGTHSGPFYDIAPTGRRVSVQELVFYKVRDNKLLACRGDLDSTLRDTLLHPTAQP